MNKKLREPLEKSGMEDDPVADWEDKICMSPYRKPPSHLYIPPGMRYRHVCPACGYTVIMRGSNVRFCTK